MADPSRLPHCAIGLINTLNRLAIGFRYTHPVGTPKAA
jgi:hypothetical protein